MKDLELIFGDELSQGLEGKYILLLLPYQRSKAQDQRQIPKIVVHEVYQLILVLSITFKHLNFINQTTICLWWSLVRDWKLEAPSMGNQGDL